MRGSFVALVFRLAPEPQKCLHKHLPALCTAQGRAAWCMYCERGSGSYHVKEGCDEAFCGAIPAAQQVVVHIRIEVHAV